MIAGNVSWRVCFLVMLFGNSAVAEGADDERFFEAKVRPLIVKHCLKCHAGTKPKGGLRLDSRDGWQRGGDSGPAIVAGKPDSSLLVRAVRHDDGVSDMPPKENYPGAPFESLKNGSHVVPRTLVALTRLRGVRPVGLQLAATGAFNPSATPQYRMPAMDGLARPSTGSSPSNTSEPEFNRSPTPTVSRGCGG